MELRHLAGMCLGMAVAGLGMGCETLPESEGGGPDAGQTLDVDRDVDGVARPDAGPADAPTGKVDAGTDARDPSRTDADMDAGATDPMVDVPDASDLGSMPDMDGAMGPLTCADLTCDEHATCLEVDGFNDAGVDAGTSGDALCLCNEGYMGDGVTCARDECVPLGDARPACAEHATCLDADPEPTGVLCTCNEGYVGMPDAQTACVRNECVALEGEAPACGDHAMCTADQPGEDDYTCECESEEYASCDGSTPVRACQTHLPTNPNHCGECGFACASGLDCTDGECEQAAWRLRGGSVMCAFTGPPASNGAGPVRCWGGDQRGFIDSGAPAAIPLPAQLRVLGSGHALDVEIGSNHACYTSPADDYVRCWGLTGPQLGDDLLGLASTTGVHTTRVGGAKTVALGWAHSCVATSAEALYCWGHYDALGLGGSGSDRDYPTKVLESTRHVEASGFYTCAIRTDGRVTCWGRGETPRSIQTIEGSALRGVEELVVRGGPYNEWACALTSANDVMCWGYTPKISAAGGNADYQHAELVDLGAQKILDIAGGAGHACALSDKHEVTCWGYNDSGAVDPTTGPVSDHVGPVLVASDQAILDIEATGTTTCGRRKDGQVICWGANHGGQLGDGTTKARLCLREVDGLPAPSPPACP